MMSNERRRRFIHEHYEQLRRERAELRALRRAAKKAQKVGKVKVRIAL